MKRSLPINQPCRRLEPARFRRPPLFFEITGLGNLPRRTPGESRLYPKNNRTINENAADCQDTIRARLSPSTRVGVFQDSAFIKRAFTARFLPTIMSSRKSWSGRPRRTVPFELLHLVESHGQPSGHLEVATGDPSRLNPENLAFAFSSPKATATSTPMARLPARSFHDRSSSR